jgi:cellulose synthase/poly-beta-1,6-N-acetylglucosamine synthase-like glycosyltransferase
MWFDFMLPALQRLKMPIPLGGTSNHFIKDKLVELGGWDPYNVTEDADLGIRASAYGYKISMLDSTTLEEAPLSVISWIKQRTRWIKGYMQTYIVHMRQPKMAYKSLGLIGFTAMQFFIGAPGIAFFMLPITLLATIHTPPLPESLYWFSNVCYANLLFNMYAILVMAVFISIYNKWRITLAPFIFPMYWFLHTIASFYAFWQLIFKPHYWNKTEHGMSKFVDSKDGGRSA